VREPSKPQNRSIAVGEVSPRALPLAVGSDAGAVLSLPSRDAFVATLVLLSVPLRTRERRSSHGPRIGPSVPSLSNARARQTECSPVPGAFVLRAAGAVSRRADARASEVAAKIAFRTPFHAEPAFAPRGSDAAARRWIGAPHSSSRGSARRARAGVGVVAGKNGQATVTTENVLAIVPCGRFTADAGFELSVAGPRFSRASFRH
jgi:hypothetical protein